MKKALAMLLTLAMLFSCLVVGVAEEAKYCPPQKVEDVKEEWIVHEDTWPEGEVVVETYVDGVHATYIDGVLNSYGYSIETETGSVHAGFTADHRLDSLYYWDNAAGESYDSYNGGKSWTQWDEETWENVKAELPEGAVIPETPALGEYVYLKPVVADKLDDVDLENGKVTEYDWGETGYENSTVSAYYNENGYLTSYSYWNEDHTVRITCNYKHKVLSYSYDDGYDYYNSTDGETWYTWKWDEELGESFRVEVELPEYAEFEKIPPLGEYVYSVAAPVDQLDVENVTTGRLNPWYAEEGVIGGYDYELGDVWASYTADGLLTNYCYDSEDGKQTNYYNWNHELTEIGIATEDGGWMFSQDGGETWGQWIWDEEAGESNYVETELPEGTVIADLPALGTPAEYDRVPVQNIEDLETRLGWVYEEEDEEGNVITVFYSSDLAMHMYFDAEGALISYDFWAEDWSEYVEYSADNELLYGEFWTEDAGYIYDAETDTWYERVFDENGEEQKPVELEKKPEGVEVPGPLTNKVDEVWYPNNTMGVLGLSLRDTFPGLTNKWYNVVPVDISVDGTTTIPLVASNLYFISNAYVTVNGDSVTVTYDGVSPHGYGWIEDECVAWFTSVDQITTEWLNNPTSDLAFGQEISRANDLDNAEIALLFICNHVTYRQPFYTNDAFLPRYWPNLAQWKAYRADLSALLNEMTLVASPDAEIVDSPDAEIIDSPSADVVASPDAGAVAE